MPSDLIKAFNATDFIVGGVAIRVGRRSLAVDQLLADRCVHACAFITAFDPFSTRTSIGINLARDHALRRELRLARIEFTRAAGNGEAGVVAFGISRVQASRIGRQFRQDAIVYARFGRPAELITLRWLA